MTYRESLSPWCIIQHFPKMQLVIIARFRKRNDAEDHLRILRYLNTATTYELMFDPPCEERTVSLPAEARAMVKRNLDC